MVFYNFLPLVRQRPKGQGLGFTMAWKQKIWHSWIHVGKRIAWNNLWSGALDTILPHRVGLVWVVQGEFVGGTC